MEVNSHTRSLKSRRRRCVALTRADHRKIWGFTIRRTITMMSKSSQSQCHQGPLLHLSGPKRSQVWSHQTRSISLEHPDLTMLRLTMRSHSLSAMWCFVCLMNGSCLSVNQKSQCFHLQRSQETKAILCVSQMSLSCTTLQKDTCQELRLCLRSHSQSSNRRKSRSMSQRGRNSASFKTWMCFQSSTDWSWKMISPRHFQTQAWPYQLSQSQSRFQRSRNLLNLHLSPKRRKRRSNLNLVSLR